MGQINDTVLSRGRTRRLQKLKENRLRQAYLNPHIEPATTPTRRLKMKMHCHSPIKGLLKREEPPQIRLQKSPQNDQNAIALGDSNPQK
jgi:hypothetical protein